MTEKDQKIIEDATHEDIPIFVLTAKDKMALDTLIAYRDFCANSCSKEHFWGIEKRIDEFYEWSKNNKDKMKNPD